MLAGVGVAALWGCRDRERLVFPAPAGDGRGPDVEITQPLRGRDTTITLGQSATILGFAADPDGIDSVWFTVQGLSYSIPPILGQGNDTVFFDLTFGPSVLNDSGTVRLYISAVDQLSDTGQTRSVGIKVVP